MSEYQTRMRAKLTSALAPTLLEIHDDSAKHAGHAGHNPLGETHFSLYIISAKFAGLTPVARHRLVYETLSTELAERVHALTIKARTPAETA